MPAAFTLTNPGKAQAAVHDYTIDWDERVSTGAAQR